MPIYDSDPLEQFLKTLSEYKEISLEDIKQKAHEFRGLSLSDKQALLLKTFIYIPLGNTYHDCMMLTNATYHDDWEDFTIGFINEFMISQLSKFYHHEKSDPLERQLCEKWYNKLNNDANRTIKERSLYCRI